MKHIHKYKGFLLFISDIIILYIILYIIVWLRFYNTFSWNILKIHLQSFTPVFIIWIIILYINHFYDNTFTLPGIKIISSLGRIALLNLFISIIYFYLFSFVGITPKTNLLLIWGLSFLCICLNHIWFSIFIQKQKPLNIIIISQDAIALDLSIVLNNNPQFGYKLVDRIDNPDDYWKLTRLIESQNVDVIIIDKHFPNNNIKNILFNALWNKIQIIDFIDFYESILKKTPLSLIDDPEFLSKIEDKTYQILEPVKRTIDIILGLTLFLITLPLWPIIIIGILIDDFGPIFYIGKRIGKNHKEFYLIKFRSMTKNASNGPRWTLPNDQRITKFGKFLRKLYLDEIPEFINVIKGDISLVGPRPEEAKLVALFEKEIPFYNIRHIVKPGITGWAQIHYSNSYSVEGTKEKLKYDLYYLRHYSLWLDLMIILKTLHIPLDIKSH